MLQITTSQSHEISGRRISIETPEPVSGDEQLMLKETEVSMEIQMIQETDQKPCRTTSDLLCAHQRIIDDVRTRGGKRTGKVRCLECGAIFDDPYRGSR